MMVSGVSPPAPAPESAALFQSVRARMTSRDQEAMRRARWTIIDAARDTGSSNTIYGANTPAPRRSSLSNQLDMATDGTDATPRATAASTTESTDQSTEQEVEKPTPEYVIAVVGHDGVGKSTVIKRAIKTWGGTTSVTNHTPDGHTFVSSFTHIKASPKLPKDCKVEFVEINLRALDLSGVAPVWPANMSPVSGAILCYDAGRADTLRGLSEALHQLCPALPMVLFACKSDPDMKLEVDAMVGDSIGQPYNVGLIEVTTASSQGKHKMRTGLRWLLYRLEERQRRQLTAADTGTTATSSSTQRNGHRSGGEGTHSSSSSLGHLKDRLGAEASTDGSVESTPTLEGEKTVPDQPTARPRQNSEANVGELPEYASLQELMNRLFTAIVSTENDEFVQAFFMTYRRFCQPRALMTEFYERFQEVEQYAVSRDIRLWALMKLAGALLMWASKYPGDLTDPETQNLFRKSVTLMLKYTFLAHLSADLVQVEQSLSNAVDVDESWSYRPRDQDTLPGSETPTETVPPSPMEVEEIDVADDSFENESSTNNTPVKDKPASMRTISTASLSIDGEGPYKKGISDRATDSSSSLSRSAYSGDDAGHKRWSSALHTILRMDAHVFALELTRLQWEMFSAMRPRDVLRHDMGKERHDPVGRSIEFFNHLSRWVSTMVLAHPKPKTRARVYESFVRVTHQLRRLNNYDSLCAVLSGLRETSIHRLTQTHAQIHLEPSLFREFQSHVKLMDARGGYVHYRRALQADIKYGHSAIPLLTTVLSLVSRLQAARPEDRRPNDDFIQWGKFSKFGEILSVIPDFQARGSMAPGQASAAFRRLIEATPVISNEDGLYERSKLVEPGGPQGGSGSGGGMLRKLANLAL